MLMAPRKRLIIAATAAALAVVLGVGGWLTYTTILLNDARASYEAAVADLETAQSDAEAEADTLAAATQTLANDLTVAEQLVALLGEGSETLLAAADGTRASRESIDGYEAPDAPEGSAGNLPENPGVDEYVTLRDAVEALTARWRSHADDLAEGVETVTSGGEALTALWQAQIDTAADSAAAAIAANANASQEAKDAATAAAEALVELSNPLAAEAPELWKALLDANSTLAAQEKEFQERKAAEEAAAAEAARRAAQAPRSPSSGGGSSGGGTSGGGGSSSIDAILTQLEALVARDKGVDVSQVNCFVPQPGVVRCDWPGGSSTTTI